MATNWRHAFFPASFKGFPFEVESESGFGSGRRVGVHKKAHGDYVTEDMGAAVPDISFNAYLASETVMFEGLGFEATCGTFGVGFLTLPMGVPIMAHCTQCKRERSLDTNGLVGYKLRFIPAKSAAMQPAGGMSGLRNVFQSGISSLGKVFGSLR